MIRMRREVKSESDGVQQEVFAMLRDRCEDEVGWFGRRVFAGTNDGGRKAR